MVRRFWPAVVGVFLGVAGLAGTSSVQAEGVRDAEVQILGNPSALRALANADDGAGRRFLKEIRQAYATAGFTRLNVALGGSDHVIALYGSEPLSPAALTRARAEIRKIRAARQADSGLVVAVAAGETLPDYFALADTYVTQAARIANNRATGRKPTAGVSRKPTTAWVTVNAQGEVSHTGSSGSVSVSVNLGITGTVGTIGVFGGLYLAANTGERWIAVATGVIPDTEVLRTVISEKWTFSGDLAFPVGTTFLKVSSEATVPDDAYAFAPGSVSLGTPQGDATLIFGQLNATTGRWGVVPPDGEVPAWAKSRQTYAHGFQTADAAFPAGSTLVSLPTSLFDVTTGEIGNLPALPAGSQELAVPFSVQSSMFTTFTGGEITFPLVGLNERP